MIYDSREAQQTPGPRLPTSESGIGVALAATGCGTPDHVDLASGLPALTRKRSRGDQEGEDKRQSRRSHDWKIGTTLALTLASVACAGNQYGPTDGPSRQALLAGMPTLPLSQILIADRAGLSPSDTAVTFHARQGRTVVMRHTAPDNSIYAILTVPADSSASDSVTVSLRATPGRYGLRLGATPRLPSGSVLTFSYAIHFIPPATVPNGTYPTISRYADWLGLGRMHDDSSYKFLPHNRPGGDMLRATISEPGEFLIAAPVTPP